MTPVLAGQVAKFVALLSSDQDHEVLAAVRALKRALAREQLDLHAVADAIKLHGAPSPRVRDPRPEPPAAADVNDRAIRARVNWLYAHQWDRLGAWEQQGSWPGGSRSCGTAPRPSPSPPGSTSIRSTNA